MNKYKALSISLMLLLVPTAYAADIALPGINVTIGQGGTEQVATALKVLIGITVLSLAPALLIVMTSFTRIIIVLSILRHALGMQQTPPNTVLVSLALLLTIFNMAPTFRAIDQHAFRPYMEGRIGTELALKEATKPFKDFMVRQTREQDLMAMYDISKTERPQRLEDIDMMLLIPSFLLSELRVAFQIGFIVFLPFLLIDIVVSSILMSMGMMMVPPMMISLPIKILVFVLIDGWNILAVSLINSFK